MRVHDEGRLLSEDYSEFLICKAWEVLHDDFRGFLDEKTTQTSRKTKDTSRVSPYLFVAKKRGLDGDDDFVNDGNHYLENVKRETLTVTLSPDLLTRDYRLLSAFGDVSKLLYFVLQHKTGENGFHGDIISSKRTMFARAFGKGQSAAALAVAAKPARGNSFRSSTVYQRLGRRAFHESSKVLVVKPFLLADIGEGIRECEVIQWFVEPEARVEQFDKLCEVQSDKASVEITSRFDGVIKKLHYDAGEMAIVGKPLCDIDIQGGVGEEAIVGAATSTAQADEAIASAPVPEPKIKSDPAESAAPVASHGNGNEAQTSETRGKHATLSTPAVRYLTKELGVQIEQVVGTGKEGRVTKEDIYRFVEERRSQSSTGPRPASTKASSEQPQTAARKGEISPQEDEILPLTQMQMQMFKAMTRSLSIPHFTYADEVCMDKLTRLRSSINTNLASSSSAKISRISYMPFFIKAVSAALDDYPLLNSRVDMDSDDKPRLVMRASHNIGIAMDTPQGLLVPNIKDVGSKSILEVAAELQRLQAAGASGKLSAADLTGGTISVSNIGNLGGTYVSPVIVTSEVAILGIGRTKTVPAFDATGAVVPTTVVNMSWAADHRVVDGSTMARMANKVKQYTEEPELMLARLR